MFSSKSLDLIHLIAEKLYLTHISLFPLPHTLPLGKAGLPSTPHTPQAMRTEKEAAFSAEQRAVQGTGSRPC